MGPLLFRKCTRSDRHFALFNSPTPVENSGSARAKLALFHASTATSLDVSLDGANWEVEHDGRDALGVVGHVGEVERRGTIPIWASSFCIRAMCDDEYDICNLL